MTETAREDQFDRMMRKTFLLSLGAHFLIVLFAWVKPVLFKSEPLVFESAIRVDMVALPDKFKDDTSLPAPSPVPPIEKKAEPLPPVPKEATPKIDTSKVNLNADQKLKESQAKALEKLKAMEAMKKLLENQNRKDYLERKAQFEKQYKGNQLSAGASMVGVQKMQFDAYISDLDRQIKKFWSLPEWLARGQLTARAMVRIDSAGQVLEKRITKSSGNPTYDSLILKAIEDAVPFPPPPEKFQGVLGSQGVVFGFPD
ncbi:MAG: TonB family protein [Bdellovibrionales bacterium]|nr:TonB family protein [Bdellovibrionales bacterium]